MKTTLTAMRADIGSVGGHLQPSGEVVEAVQQSLEGHKGEALIDFDVSFTGDDITVLCSHGGGLNHDGVQGLIWQAFARGAEQAKDQGLYSAGQDIFREGMSGAAKRMGPSLVEMEIEERENEAFLLFSIDKSVPGAFNLPLYLSFADPMHCPGLVLSPRMRQGFRFEIMDVVYKAHDRVVMLEAPEDLYNIAALLRDERRFAIRRIHSRTTGDLAAAVSTIRLHNVAGIVLGKDDPVALVRVQDAFPAAGELLAPFQLGPCVGGSLRGSHYAPLMPVRLNSGVSFFDGPPCVSCGAYSLRQGRLTTVVDAFDHPLWDHVRDDIAARVVALRRQGFFGNAMQPLASLNYGGIFQILQDLDERFTTAKPEGS